jgi:cell wall-associated NlpC family hydrolase
MARVVQKSAMRLLLFLLVALTSACAGTQRPAPPPASFGTIGSFSSGRVPDPAADPGLVALDEARKMLGVAYRYGGSDPRGFDCSGLVGYTFSRAGVALPRTSRDIFRSSQLINPQDMQPGDLVFFTISAQKVSHVGIYAGDDRFIHAPSSGKGVGYASLGDSYWSRRLFAVGRIGAEARTAGESSGSTSQEE